MISRCHGYFRTRLILLTMLGTTCAIPVRSYPQSRTIDSWIDFKFEASASMGDARNPAIILSAEFAALLGNVPGAKKNGNAVFVPAAEFQRAAKQPLAAVVLGPLLRQVSNVKSFDGFNAVDMTGVIKNLPSEILEAPDAMARKTNPQNYLEIKQQLRDGDIVLGAHVINYITWGRFNHVAIVLDAKNGTLAESTAQVPTDLPGVRLVDWEKFISGYARIGVVRLKPSHAAELPRVLGWISDRKGRPYRWPIIQGLDKFDQSRF